MATVETVGYAQDLRDMALAAVAATLPGAATAGEPLELQFLHRHREIAQDREGWLAALVRYLEHPAPVDRPLLALAAHLRFTPIEVLSVALTAAVENDPMVGRSLAYVQSPVGGSRPTVGLLAAAFGPRLRADGDPIATLTNGAALASGVLTLGAESAPLPERTAAIPLAMCQAFGYGDGIFPGAQIETAEDRSAAVPPSFAEASRRHALALNHSSPRLLVLRTGSPLEGRAVASAVARAMGRRAVFISVDRTAGLAPWMFLRKLLPVFMVDLGPGERKLLPAIPYHDGPVLALCGPDGAIESEGATALSWWLPVPSREEREQLWRLAIQDESLAADLARQHRHGCARIAGLGRLAAHQASIHGRERAAQQDVAQAARSGEGLGLEGLAQLLPEPIPDDALVMPPALRTQMSGLVLRCHARDGLTDALGASAQARYSPGVRALFVGPSGTGKTLAAGWLATRLGIPLYRVDLASVTSKYIGETEKHLARLMARAERAEVVLLFDEADSLFGKRTDVHEANDRFANAQTNYLLQRIEAFEGITILTSNSRTRFDQAFTRRLDAIIEFPLPGPEERRALWHAHLGTHHRLASRDLNQIAVAADFSGGDIRNTVLTAAVAARQEGRPIEYGDLCEALAIEFRKQGRQLPVELSRV
jgi:hypothetical protein